MPAPTDRFTPDDLAEHLAALHRYALGVTRDPDAAADVVQEVVLRALERRDQFRGDAPLEHWLMRIAHNLVIDRARRSGREVPVDEIDVDHVEESWRDDDYTVDAARVVERVEVRDDLLDALVHLPFIYRSAVVLHDIEGLRVADVAAIHDDGRRRASRGVPLRCWDARQHVSDYMNGDLDDTTAEMIEAHLGGCPTCPPLYAGLVGVDNALGSLRDPDSVVGPELETRIRSLLD